MLSTQSSPLPLQDASRQAEGQSPRVAHQHPSLILWPAHSTLIEYTGAKVSQLLQNGEWSCEKDG